MAEFNFREVVANEHDYVGKPFNGLGDETALDYALSSLSSVYGTSHLLGRNLFFTLVLKHKNIPYPFPNEPLISLNLVKTIVETPTVGKYRKGTVKEYINTEDYQITIRGVCVNKAKAFYPVAQVAILNKMFSINEALDVFANPFLALFGIEKIVLKDIHFDDMKGKPYLQSYTITAVSDQPFFAELTERNKIIN